MSDEFTILTISYDPLRISGRILHYKKYPGSSIWERIRAHVIANQTSLSIDEDTIELPWPELLRIIREFGSASVQKSLNFRFQPDGEAIDRINDFVKEVRQARVSKDSLTANLSTDEIKSKLVNLGFTRELKPFQLRDIEHLISLPHGANFSVPGAGKTTVTFALHLLTRKANQHLFVVCPKSAFPAWSSIVQECIAPEAPNYVSEPFTLLDSGEPDTDRILRSGSTRFIMSYDLLIRQQSTISAYLARQPVHLVLDESHRMKAGLESQRGAFLLNIASLPVRRDILSGTPMPQSANDISSQLGFLWPGLGLDLKIQRGETPRNVLGNLFVRTTKQELNLPPVYRKFYQVKMAPGQMALYGVVRNEALRQLTKAIKSGIGNPDYLSARKSVMRLLQLSVNPTLALSGMAGDDVTIDSGIVEKVLEEGTSTKMLAVADHVRKLASDNLKTVVWTIFTSNIYELERLLPDLNPVTIYGGVPSGSPGDSMTREGRLKRFHEDSSCKVLIANPAAAGEGISLHTVCHNAIYLDRSYVSTHYLQSIDRIHRLGLKEGVETFIHIYQTKAPPALGSIDLSVSRRLASKIRNLQELLDDPDLHEIALDEESADDPIDYNFDLQDLIDLVEELEGKKGDSSLEEL